MRLFHIGRHTMAEIVFCLPLPQKNRSRLLGIMLKKHLLSPYYSQFDAAIGVIDNSYFTEANRALLYSIALDNENINHYENAIRKLLQLGKIGHDILYDTVLQSDNKWLRNAILSKLLPDDLFNIIQTHPDNETRIYAASQLYYKPYDVSYLPVLLNIIHNERDDCVREHIALAFRGEKVALYELCIDNDPKIRLAIVKALRPENEVELKLLANLSTDTDEAVRIAASTLLEQQRIRCKLKWEAEQERAKIEENRRAQEGRIRNHYTIFSTIETVSLTVLAAFLVDMLDCAYRKGHPDIDMDEAMACRIIGEELLRRGNGRCALMHQVITTMLGHHNSSRCLDVWWNGVGGWQG